MTRTSRFRLFSGLLFTLMLAMAAPAFAQETLPPPAAPEGANTAEDIIIIFVPVAAQPVHPVNNGDLGMTSPFIWTSTGADQYVIKVTVKETGAKFSWKPTYNCYSNTCYANKYEEMPALFDKLHDGQHIVWRVVSKFGEIKMKSEKATAIVNEVTQVTLTAPANGSTIAFDSLKMLSWEGHQSVNNQYQVTVKDMTLGMVVYARLYKNISYNCASTCSIEIPYAYDSFTKGHTYQWTVTAIGLSGETAKSTKATFTLN